MAGVAAGPGGLVYGILITLPALAPLFQIAALLGFWGREHALRRSPTQAP
jgi:hypothetical protein